MIQSTGEEEFGEHDSANIPCNIFITEIDWDDLREMGLAENMPKWAKYQLTADIFMPRKGLYDTAYEYVADNKEELRALVRKHVLPSYQIALDAVTALTEGKRDTFYYWSKND